MSATPSRRQFISQGFRRAIAEDTAVRTKHGMLARESEDPIETGFDSVADATTVATERLALLSGERRKFAVRVIGLDEVLALDPTSGVIPNAWFIDTERDCDRMMLIATCEIDLGSQQATLGLWG